MGLTFVEANAKNLELRKEKTLSFFVDSGTTYTLLPLEVWQYLELSPIRRVDFILADGTKMQKDVSECFIELENVSGHSLSNFGGRR